MICEGQVFLNGVARQCGAPARVHLTEVSSPPGRSAQAVTRHLCETCGRVAQVDALIVRARERGPEGDHARATLGHAGVHGLNPVAHAYEAPGLLRPEEDLRCLRCGLAADASPYHTHVIYRKLEAARVELEGVREEVADPRAAMRAVDAARAACTQDIDCEQPECQVPQEVTPHELGRRALERERAGRRNYMAALEALAGACRAARDGLAGLGGSITPFLAAVDAARAERDAALGAVV